MESRTQRAGEWERVGEERGRAGKYEHAGIPETALALFQPQSRLSSLVPPPLPLPETVNSNVFVPGDSRLALFFNFKRRYLLARQLDAEDGIRVAGLLYRENFLLPWVS